MVKEVTKRGRELIKAGKTTRRSLGAALRKEGYKIGNVRVNKILQSWRGRTKPEGWGWRAPGFETSVTKFWKTGEFESKSDARTHAYKLPKYKKVRALRGYKAKTKLIDKAKIKAGVSLERNEWRRLVIVADYQLSSSGEIVTNVKSASRWMKTKDRALALEQCQNAARAALGDAESEWTLMPHRIHSEKWEINKI